MHADSPWLGAAAATSVSGRVNNFFLTAVIDSQLYTQSAVVGIAASAAESGWRRAANTAESGWLKGSLS